MARVRRRNFTRAERALMYVGMLGDRGLDWINEQLAHSQQQLGLDERLMPESSYLMLEAGYGPYFVKQSTFTTGEDNSPFSLTIDQIDWDLICDTIVTPAAVSTLKRVHTEVEATLEENIDTWEKIPWGQDDPDIEKKPVYHWNLLGDNVHEKYLEEWLEENYKSFKGTHEDTAVIKLIRTKWHLLKDKKGKELRTHETHLGHRHRELRIGLQDDWPQEVHLCKRHKNQISFIESFLKEKGIF
jgi:hypothetical protein